MYRYIHVIIVFCTTAGVSLPQSEDLVGENPFFNHRIPDSALVYDFPPGLRFLAAQHVGNHCVQVGWDIELGLEGVPGPNLFSSHSG